MKLTLKITISLLMNILVCTPLFAITIYVDQVSGDNMNDGLTSGTAVATITHGRTLISDGDIINIGPGIYTTSSGETYPVNFIGNINLQGAGSEQTILDGQLSSSILSFSGSSSSVIIDGLAIINGNSAIGGGVSAFLLLQFTLSNCRINNNDGDIGGGIFIQDTPEISIYNCYFDGNNASIGGAVQIQINTDINVNMDVVQSTFSNNTGNFGSSIQFQENGNGVHTMNIEQCQFFNNDNFGVLYKTNAGSSFGQISNSLFAEHPGTALTTIGSDINIVNSTFVNNQIALDAENQTNIINSIFWQNGTEMVGTGGSVSFSIIQGHEIDNQIDDGNNIDMDPLLDNSYHLTQNSPAIDMGSDQAVDNFGLTQDLDLENRKADALGLNRPEGIVDIGADETPPDLMFSDDFES